MHKIKKAIIPVAGLATRMYPISKAVKKALLPVCDIDGRIKPLIFKLLEELVVSGIEEIFLIVNDYDKEVYKKIFEQSSSSVLAKLSSDDKEYDKNLKIIGDKITYIVQNEALGFGHAVYLARDYINKEPVILLLGDTLYKSLNNSISCVEQLLQYFDDVETTIIALKELKEDELKYYGTVQGKWINDEKNKLILSKIVEKPNIEYAKKNLLIDNKFYGNFGEFILTEELFVELENIISKPLIKGTEYQLMDAFDNLINKSRVDGLIIDGNSYDMGNIAAYKDVLRNY